MEDKPVHIVRVFAGLSDGKPVHEELPAYKNSYGEYELLSSPGLALNLAKGDIVDLTFADKPAKILKRGGNFCIQIYGAEFSVENLEEFEESIATVLSGSVDGIYKGNLAISIPSGVGLEKINKFFDHFTKKLVLNGISPIYIKILKM